MSSERDRASSSLALSVVGGACIVVVLAIAAVVARADLPFDIRLLRFAAVHRDGWPSAVAKDVSWLGSMVVLLPLAVLVGTWLAVRGRPRPALFVVAAVAGASVLQNAAKAIVDRPRPVVVVPLVDATSSSFPSGHATQSMAGWIALAVVLTWGGSRSVRLAGFAAAAAVAVIVGASRVVLGVHFPSDVVAGFALGGAWVSALALVLLVPSGDPAPPELASEMPEAPPPVVAPPP